MSWPQFFILLALFSNSIFSWCQRRLSLPTTHLQVWVSWDLHELMDVSGYDLGRGLKDASRVGLTTWTAFSLSRAIGGGANDQSLKELPDRRVTWSSTFPATRVSQVQSRLSCGDLWMCTWSRGAHTSEHGKTTLLLFATNIAWLPRSIIVTTADEYCSAIPPSGVLRDGHSISFNIT